MIATIHTIKQMPGFALNTDKLTLKEHVETAGIVSVASLHVVGGTIGHNFWVDIPLEEMGPDAKIGDEFQVFFERVKAK